MSQLHRVIALCPHPSAPADLADCYHYDDPSVGVEAELLFPSTSEVIAAALMLCGYGNDETPHPKVEIVFSDDYSALQCEGYEHSGLPLLQLDFKEDLGDDNSMYLANARRPPELLDAFDLSMVISEPAIDGYDAFLCAHLLDYFDAPPKTFWAHLKPL